MMPNLVTHLVIWAVLATIMVFLAIYRRRVFMKGDELLHVLDEEAPLIHNQEVVAKKLDKLDLWGKILTTVVVLYAVTIGGLYLYFMFTDTKIRL